VLRSMQTQPPTLLDYPCCRSQLLDPAIQSHSCRRWWPAALGGWGWLPVDEGGWVCGVWVCFCGAVGRRCEQPGAGENWRQKVGCFPCGWSLLGGRTALTRSFGGAGTDEDPAPCRAGRPTRSPPVTRRDGAGEASGRTESSRTVQPKARGLILRGPSPLPAATALERVRGSGGNRDVCS
jgi:hypothetical protein